KYSELPRRLRRYRDDIFDDKYKRLAWNDLSRSITAHLAKDGYWYIHPTQRRTLSVREAARIQTFPDWFRFAGPPSHRYRQIGNAVPPLLAEALGRELAAARAPRHAVPRAALARPQHGGPRSRARPAPRAPRAAHRAGAQEAPWRRRICGACRPGVRDEPRRGAVRYEHEPNRVAREAGRQGAR